LWKKGVELKRVERDQTHPLKNNKENISTKKHELKEINAD